MLIRSIKICLAVSIIAGCGSSYRMTMDDTVCRAGEKARIVAKLHWQNIPDPTEKMNKKDISFYMDDFFIGIDDTDDDGYAGIKRRFDPPGVKRMKAIFSDNRGRYAEANSRVYVWGKNDPILIVDIDGTICRTNNLALVLKSDDNISTPMSGAAEALTELSKQFHIVYLTFRPREYIYKTRQWLKSCKFPNGPLLTWDLDKQPWSVYDYKKKQIDNIQDDFKNVRIGIGNTEKDYQAYKKRKLFSIIITPGQPATRIDHGIKVPDWQQAKDEIKNYASLE